jgi:dipeptidyl aminopeptidase/acylaminoacyl peptidase
MRHKHIDVCLKIVIAVVVCFSAGSLAAQNSSSTKFQEVAISPDGTRVAWVQQSLDSAGESTSSNAIYVSPLNTPEAKPRRIAADPSNSSAAEDSIAWSPDGKQIAFLSDASGKSQLYVADAQTGAAKKLTELTGFLATPGWSPDGKTIAMLFTENAPRTAGPLMPMTAETGVIGAKIYEQRLTLVDVASAKARQISPPDMYVFEYDWSPDAKNLVVTAAHGAGDAHWYIAHLYTLNAETEKMADLYTPKWQLAIPRWSPDGRNIAFIEGLMSDEGFTGGDIFVIPATGGSARDVTPDLPSSPAAIYWNGPDRILFAEEVDGQHGYSMVDVTSSAITRVWSGAEATSTGSWGLPDVSLSNNGKTSAIIRSSTAKAPEIWAGPVGEWKQVTFSNGTLRPNWGELKSLHWMSDGMKIQGWLMYPTNYDASKKYPMVVEAHGGPAGAVHIGWPEAFYNTHELTAHGYFVFYPNPRGSYGQGEKYTQGNVKDFGYGDFRDIMTGVDEVLKTVPVDPSRLGITGWSYGGYMTMWAVTQTNRFKAAVSGAGLSDWLSYYGENDIDDWMPPYFGATVYDDPAVYSRSAPMNYIKNVKTPTLVLVGERDGECPAPQSEEFWHALQTLGVETQLVIYPGEGHVFLQPQHRRDVMDRMTKWFDKYLKQPAS